MATDVLSCGNCGAALPAARGEPVLRCAYCGHETETTRARVPAAAPPAASAASTGAGAGAGRAITVVAFAVALIGGLVATSVALRSKPPATPVATSSTSVAPAPSAASPFSDLPRGPEHFMWVDQYACPVGIDVTGDGVEDIAGPFVLESNGKLEVYVGVLDGKDFHLVWKAGPFGIRDKATRRTGVAVARNRMLAVEVTGLAHLLDLQDGHEIAVLPYTESDTRGLCAPPDDDSVFYLGTPWRAGTLVDVATGTSHPGRAPKGCTYDGPRRPRDTGDTGIRHVMGVGAAPPAGFDWKRSPVGDSRDAIGVATPKGDEGVVVVGLDPKTMATRWQRGAANLFGEGVDGAEVYDIAEGVAYVAFASSIAAVDAPTGTVKWTAPRESDVFNVTLTHSRLYVVTGEWSGLPVDVYDVPTGKRIARVGHGPHD